MSGVIPVAILSGMLTAVRMLSGFLIVKAVAVCAGPTGIALLGQAQNLMNSMSGVAAASAGNGLVRFTAESYSNGYEACAPWWRATLRWTVALTSGTSLIAILFSQSLAGYLFGEKNYFWVVIMAGCILPFATLNTLIPSVLNGLQQYRSFIGLGVISVVASTSVAIALIYKSGMLGAILAMAVFSAVSGVIMVLAACTRPWFKKKYWIGSTQPFHLQATGGYVLMALTASICGPLSSIAVRNILVEHVGWEDTGYWQAVSKISEAYLGVITVALSTYFLPKLSRLKTKVEIKQEIQSTLRFLLPVSAFLAFSVYIGRDLAINILLTPQFTPARELFATQLLGDVIKICAWLYAYPMLSRGATAWYVSSEIVFASLFVTLAWTLVPKFGVQAACIAYVINYTVYLAFTFLCVDYYAK